MTPRQSISNGGPIGILSLTVCLLIGGQLRAEDDSSTSNIWQLGRLETSERPIAEDEFWELLKSETAKKSSGHDQLLVESVSAFVFSSAGSDDLFPIQPAAYPPSYPWIEAEPVAPEEPQDFPPIGSLTIDVRPPAPPQDGEINLPTDHSADLVAARMNMTSSEARRDWCPQGFFWSASQMVHRPLYFEDVNLERYGHNHGCLQPAVSGVKFATDILLVPYRATLAHGDPCVYELGYFRPGSCAPWVVYHEPLDLKAAVVTGAFWTGFAFFLFP